MAFFFKELKNAFVDNNLVNCKRNSYKFNQSRKKKKKSEICKKNNWKSDFFLSNFNEIYIVLLYSIGKCGSMTIWAIAVNKTIMQKAILMTSANILNLYSTNIVFLFQIPNNSSIEKIPPKGNITIVRNTISTRVVTFAVV